MKKLMTAIAALALTTTMAQAQTVTVGEAWEDTAIFKAPIPPMDPNLPPGAIVTPPLKPGDLEIPTRVFKTCVDGGQCAYVDQVGADNSVNIDQTTGADGSVADVVQIGNNNAAGILQDGLSGTSGLADYAVITQNGDLNTGAIRQSNDAPPNTGHYADIQQGGDGVTGSGGTSLANQNMASIDQGYNGAGNPVTSHGLVANILQEGRTFTEANNNMGKIRQNGDEMLARIDQDGSANQASIIQTGTGDSAGNDNSELNEASITQVGLSNDSATVQEGVENRSSVVQVGNFNVESTEQRGIGNTAVTQQRGDSNLSVTMQIGDDNMASTVQAGSNNRSSTSQMGISNMASVFQLGDLNYSAIEQSGNLNAASVSQNGLDHSDIQQTGVGNLAAVVQ